MVFHYINESVKPLRAALVQANAELKAAMDKLNSLRSRLAVSSYQYHWYYVPVSSLHHSPTISDKTTRSPPRRTGGRGCVLKAVATTSRNIIPAVYPMCAGASEGVGRAGRENERGSGRETKVSGRGGSDRVHHRPGESIGERPRVRERSLGRDRGSVRVDSPIVKKKKNREREGLARGQKRPIASRIRTDVGFNRRDYVLKYQSHPSRSSNNSVFSANARKKEASLAYG